ncbi:hypothetical protein G7Z17_g4432 [Cylindrodendrum hubeiense]|uniref:Secreted protein n=1 Tax=Cylindrodendrum hubeiense TaxID=595255 RepID=A0A9P5HDW1_9HYPO|nr:hypothetical protein G7Z17_g4432 [Cylindrodendrum hubeiense]
MQISTIFFLCFATVAMAHDGPLAVLLNGPYYTGLSKPIGPSNACVLITGQLRDKAMSIVMWPDVGCELFYDDKCSKLKVHIKESAPTLPNPPTLRSIRCTSTE